MNGLPYYRAYPRDFLEGTVGMPFDIKCAYRVILDLIYLHDGRLPDDARYIAGQLGCSVRKWKSIREALIEARKIAAENEIISNFRADNELETSRKFQDKQRENASAPRKNKDLQKPRHSHTLSLPEEEEERPSVSRQNDEVRAAFDLWNELAERRGLPKARDLTDGRRSRLKARLARNGLDGWREALSRLERSSFCLGIKSDWKADLDFVLQEKSFTKLIEGAYGDDAPASAQPPPIDAEQAARESAERKAYWTAKLAQESADGEAADSQIDVGRGSADADADQLPGREEREFRREPVGGGRRGSPVQGADEDGLRPRGEDEADRGQPAMVSLDAVSPGGRATGLRGRGAFQPVGGLAGQILAGAGRISPAGE